MPTPRRVLSALSLLGVAALISCSSPPGPAGDGAALPPVGALPADLPGIHNLVVYHDGFLVGGVPEGRAGLTTLRDLGVRTIISVDGAAPDAPAANALGMRYVHLPIGYNGFDEDRRRQLVRAARDALARGPVYLHCHHGKHRAAGAAAAAIVSLGLASAQDGVALMQISGTSPAYPGLYECAARASVMSPATIDSVPGDFPQVSPPPEFVQGMVDADHALEHLRQVAAAGWRAPADHPDLVPAAEAGKLADLLRLMAADPRSQHGGFAERMLESAKAAQGLEDALGQADAAARAPGLLAALERTCKACHAAYRDKP